MGELTITVDPLRCKSMGVCLQIAPETFDLNIKSGLAFVVDPRGNPLEILRETITQCPAAAISFVETPAHDQEQSGQAE